MNARTELTFPPRALDKVLPQASARSRSCTRAGAQQGATAQQRCRRRTFSTSASKLSSVMSTTHTIGEAPTRATTRGCLLLLLPDTTAAKLRGRSALQRTETPAGALRL